MLKIKARQVDPVKCILSKSDPSGETFIEIRPATLHDESRRFSLAWKREVALATEIATAEIYTTLVSCNIQDEEGKIMLEPSLSYEEFVKRITDIWTFDAGIVWEIQEKVHEVNPQWDFRSEEGNA